MTRNRKGNQRHRSQRLSEDLEIAELDDKLQLWSVTKGKAFKKLIKEIADALKVDHEYVTRMVTRARPQTYSFHEALACVTGNSIEWWRRSTGEIGGDLGFSDLDLARVAGRRVVSIPGIDFAARKKKEQDIQRLLGNIRGYWVGLYYSTTRTEGDGTWIFRELHQIKDKGRNDFIDCAVQGSRNEEYSGWCFETVGGHIVFLYQHDNEVAAGIMDYVPGTKQQMCGIFVGLGGSRVAGYPVASKNFWVYLGIDETSALEQFKQLGGTFVKDGDIVGYPENSNDRERLMSIGGNYLSPRTKDGILAIALPYISNVIDPQTLPSCLIAKPPVSIRRR